MEPLTLGIFGFVLTRWMVTVWVLTAVASIAIAFAMVAAARRIGPTADLGILVYHHRPLVRWGSVCLAAGALGAVTAMFVAHSRRDSGDTIYVILTYSMLGSMVSALVWDVFRYRLVVGPDGLDCRSPWRRRRFIRWADVACVSFNSPVGWFEVRSADGRAVRLPAIVGNLEAFLEACERRLEPGQLEPALSAYIFLGREFPDDRIGRDSDPNS
jgi:hypothetical protein